MASNSSANPYNNFNNINYKGATIVNPYRRDEVRQDVINALDSRNFEDKFISESKLPYVNSNIINNQIPNPIPNSTIIEDTDSSSNKVISQSYTHSIVIDSSKRVCESRYRYGDSLHYLEPYPLCFTHNSNSVLVRMEKCPYIPGDYICLSGISSKKVTLRNALIFCVGSYYVKILHPHHGLTLYGTIDYEQGLIQCPEFNCFITNGSYGLTITVNEAYLEDKNITSIGSTPINELVRKHEIYLSYKYDNGFYIQERDCYYIKLETRALDNYPAVGSVTSYITLSFNNLFSVPLSQLNDSRLLVRDVNEQGFTIECETAAIIEPHNYSFYHYNDLTDSIFDSKNLIGSNIGGGRNCTLRKIIQVMEGFPNASRYYYPLDRTYSNVISAKITSSYFPNTQWQIDQDCCMLCWSNYLDGGKIYEQSLPCGNYSTQQFIETIEFSMNSMPRFNNSAHHIKAQINGTILSLESYEEIKLNVAEAIHVEGNRLLISHPDHRLVSGLNIYIENICCKIIRIVDPNSYVINCDHSIMTKLSKDVTVLYPQKLSIIDRLRCFGKINTKGFVYCVSLDIRHLKCDYFYICCPQLAEYSFRNTENVDDAIGIIRSDPRCNLPFTGQGDSYTIDTFVPYVQSYDTPLYDLSGLWILIRQPNGRFVQFNGLDYMFTIELTEVYLRPYETNIDTRINAEIRTANL
jgi:hypothetical protein